MTISDQANEPAKMPYRRLRSGDVVHFDRLCASIKIESCEGVLWTRKLISAPISFCLLARFLNRDAPDVLSCKRLLLLVSPKPATLKMPLIYLILTALLVIFGIAWHDGAAHKK